MNAVLYQVEPRFTPGSPAQVTERQARMVAECEAAAYRDILAHPDEDPRAFHLAKTAGLGGIVEAISELPAGRGWAVWDLVTDQRFERLTPKGILRRAGNPGGTLLARDVDALKALVRARGAAWVQKWTRIIDGAIAGETIGPDSRD